MRGFKRAVSRRLQSMLAAATLSSFIAAVNPS